jgi:hypothetical protein
LNLETLNSVAAVALAITGVTSSCAAVLAVRATERLEQLSRREVAAREAGLEVCFTGPLDSSTPVPRLIVTSDGAAVVVHGVALATIDARTGQGEFHPGPHPATGAMCVAHDLALPRRLHRGETVELAWPGGPAEWAACRGYGPSSTAAVSAKYSIGRTGQVETREVSVQFYSNPAQPKKEHTP